MRVSAPAELMAGGRAAGSAAAEPGCTTAAAASVMATASREAAAGGEDPCSQWNLEVNQRGHQSPGKVSIVSGASPGMGSIGAGFSAGMISIVPWGPPVAISTACVGLTICAPKPSWTTRR